MTRTSRSVTVGLIVTVGLAARRTVSDAGEPGRSARSDDDRASEVLDWNQIFIDTLIATNTANSSSQRLGAIVHTAIFDAYNGIERRYTPIFVHDRAPRGASRRAAVIAAAYTALVGLFPSQQPALDASYAASLAALSDDCEDGANRADALVRRASSAASPGEPRSRRPCSPGARPMGSARATLRSPAGPRSASGGRRRRRSRAMSAQGLAFTAMFVLVNNTQFSPDRREV